MSISIRDITAENFVEAIKLNAKSSFSIKYPLCLTKNRNQKLIMNGLLIVSTIN